MNIWAFCLLWWLSGVVSWAVIVYLFDYKAGKNITLGTILWLMVMSIAGPIVAISGVFIWICSLEWGSMDKVVIKGKVKQHDDR